MNPKVAISYSWAAEREGDAKGYATKLWETLQKKGIDVIRDTDRLKHTDSIIKFMEAVGSSDILCVFLTDAYLKSPNCMYELTVAWQRTGSPEAFRKRVLVWIGPDAQGILKAAQRAGYSKYWSDQVSQASPDDLYRLKSIDAAVDQMLRTIADTKVVIGTGLNQTPAMDEALDNFVKSITEYLAPQVHLSAFLQQTEEYCSKKLKKWQTNRFDYAMSPPGNPSGDDPPTVGDLKASDLLERVSSGPDNALIQGNGGSGKSFQIYQIALALCSLGQFVPVLMEAGAFKKDITLAAAKDLDMDIESFFDSVIKDFQINRGSKPNAVLRLADIRSQSRQIMFLINGLNEAPNDKDFIDLEKNLYSRIAKYMTGAGPRNDRAIISTRTKLSPLSGYSWEVFEMKPIEHSNLFQLLGKAGIPPSAVNEKIASILSNPFFLDLVIFQPNPASSPFFSSPSRSEVIHDYFSRPVTENGLGMNNVQLKALASVAFDAYKTGGTGFDPGLLDGIKTHDPQAFQRIQGTLVNTSLGDAGGVAAVQFDHQLKHDFLVAYYLANKQPETDASKEVLPAWKPQDLDTASFFAENRDPLEMTVDLLAKNPMTVDEKDDFLRAVYNWHLGHARDCVLADSGGDLDKDAVFSSELRTAVLSLIAQKRNDPMFHTYKDFLENRDRVSKLSYARIFEGESADLCQYIRQRTPQREWFGKWQLVFVCEPEAINQNFKKITGNDSIMAWTVANAVRYSGSLEQAAYLSAILDQKGNGDGVARWRIAFVLGAFSGSIFAEKTLFNLLLSEEEYTWARYGAGRSLMEIAARSAIDPRKRIIERLHEIVMEVNFGVGGSAQQGHARILREIGRCVLYRSVERADEWKNLTTPLVNTIEEAMKGTIYEESWMKNVRKVFDDGRWMETGELPS